MPESSASLRFAAADLTFEATSYDWMITSGEMARFKGVGTVNRDNGIYIFEMTALDAEFSSTGADFDSLRIRIWQENSEGVETVFYDSILGAEEDQSNAGTTPLGGGSITVHRSRGK